MNSELTKQIKYNPDKKKPYSYRIYVGKNELTGSYMHRQKSFKTFDEALASLVKLKKSLKDGTFHTTSKRYKYSDLVAMWLPQYKQTVKRSTYGNVTQIIDNIILPSLGMFYLDKLTVAKCQSIVNDWFSRYPSRFNSIFAYARKILEYGEHLELVNRNSLSKVIKPRQKSKTKAFTNYYSKKELASFLNACKECNQLYYVFFRLLAYTGLRSSEALGLRWSDINIFNSTLSVRRTVTNDEHWGVVIDTPKTAGSTRTIDLDPSTIELLQSWHKSNDNKVITLTNRKNYVFFNATRPEGVFIHQDARYWDKSVCHKYGLRYITPPRI